MENKVNATPQLTRSRRQKRYRRFVDQYGQDIISAELTQPTIVRLIRYYATFGMYLTEVKGY
jgi:hypothetical protein